MPDAFVHPQKFELSGALNEIVIATIVAVEPQLELRFPDMPEEHEVTSLAVFGPEAIGAKVALAFVGGERTRPLILGLVYDASELFELAGPTQGDAAEVFADGERVRVEASEELLLCCGKASITLRANGRVIVRGTQVESRAKGLNRIKGGAVAIN